MVDHNAIEMASRSDIGLQVQEGADPEDANGAFTQHQVQEGAAPEDANGASALDQVQDGAAPGDANRAFGQFVKNNIAISLLIVVVAGLVFWVGSTYLSQRALKERRPDRISTSKTQQMAAPDQIQLRAFYFYNYFVELAKNKTKDASSVSQTFTDEFKNITFWEIFNLFKVLRVIEYANQWHGIQNDDQNQNKVDIIADVEIIEQGTNKNLSTIYKQIPIQDQGDCSSCYSFPITATIEYLYWTNGIKVKLSQQQIIDCSRTQSQRYNKSINGCQEGNMTRGFQYARDQGIVSIQDYPYQSANGQSHQCKIPEGAKRYKISGFASLPKGCQAIINSVNKGQPVAAMISGERLSFWDEKKAFADCRRDRPNHAITVIGIYNNSDYYVRNSWGRSWGWDGYFRLSKGNTCGVCTQKSIVPYLKLDQKHNVIRQDRPDSNK